MAILNALNRIDQDESYILRNRMESRFFFGTPYSFQEMHIYTGNRQEQFIQNLEEALNHFMDNTTVKQLDQHGQKWAISIAGQTTHLLHLGLDKPDIQAGRGNLVIVIDDLGECMVFPRKLAELDFPVTFSILPYLPRTSEVAEFASVNGFEVMLHMPMEPDAYIRGVEPGPGALFVDMKPEQIRQQMIHALQQIPQAQGVNNHMGSAFTRNHQGMRIVFEELMKRDLFFLDSVTTPDSVAPYLAREMGLDFMQRHVFLDNIRSREAIMHQLQKAEQMASRHGMAVAIGHPHPETLQTLRHWNRERDHRVNIASVDELILQQKIMAVSAR
ncbi:divergent polysaccharide deacetylase family protein [Desulfonatronospira sp.]|uniref:divergent polysaccharide deacetylase family protein n=1 Tax=Desulfonatronospira sp. TaxID=1962951 RepID=UPI0025BF4065|nr:divergent polysaccharide deacetylase family protein [Desulfonatronospira sp.]